MFQASTPTPLTSTTLCKLLIARVPVKYPDSGRLLLTGRWPQCVVKFLCGWWNFLWSKCQQDRKWEGGVNFISGHVWLTRPTLFPEVLYVSASKWKLCKWKCYCLICWLGGGKFVIFAVIAVIRWVAVPVMPVTPCPVSSIWAGTLVSVPFPL